MKSKRCILLLGLGAAFVTIAIQRSASTVPHTDASRPHPTAAFQPHPRARVVSSSAPFTVGFKNDATAGASPLTPAEVRATVHAKLSQWLNTATGDTATQEALTKELLALLTDDNTAEIVRGLSSRELHTPFGAGALERWLSLHADAAARWLAQRVDTTEHEALLVARELGKNTAALQAYCNQLPTSAWRENVLNQASLEKACTDPVVAIALAQRLASRDTRTGDLETIAYAWFGQDVIAALQWVETIQDLRLRERLLAVGAKAIAHDDPDLAADWLLTAVKIDRSLRKKTEESLLEMWAQQSPK